MKKLYLKNFGWPLPACRTGRFRDCGISRQRENSFSGVGRGSAWIARNALILVLLGVVFGAPTVLAASLPSHPLIDQAKEKRGPRVKYALDNGAQVGLTADGKSFYILWLPEGSDPQDPPPMVVSMHGHASWAFEDFYVWHHFVKQRGYGFLAMQWWLGGGEEMSDYLLPNEVYRVIDDVFRELHIKPQTAMLHGFSRGSANIYAVAAMDRSLKKDYFSLFVANSGQANSTYPPTHEVEEGRFGEMPFAGTHWVTYAGEKDVNPDRDGVRTMRKTGEWIEKYGGTVDLAIEDPEGDHGGFHKRPQNCEKALDVFEKLRSKS